MLTPGPNQTSWTRRQFLLGSAASMAALYTLPDDLTAAERVPVTPLSEKWYTHAWRRAVIDMHIPDWDEAFLSKFSPEEYVSRLITSKAQSVVLYAQSHTGLFNYPTKVGKQHSAWHGRDVLRELIDRCHQQHIAVQLYTSIIFDRWAADTHPEWKKVNVDGKPADNGRYGVCCPNSPYREYARAWITELCQRYDFEDIRFDMTMWTIPCYCTSCQTRWQKEVGGEMPKVVNWMDERWVAYQRRREEWLADFAALCSGTVRKLKPGTTVEHQSSGYVMSWRQGVTTLLLPQNDFLQGDFYGDALQGSFVRKLLSELTPNKPFGYETSYTVALKNHTAGKSAALLEAKASAAIAESAAFIFIDAIDPIGTVNPHSHERMGKVFNKLMPYYPELGGERVADVAVYFSMESKCNFASNGKSPLKESDDNHTPAAMDATGRLISTHLPVTVITKKDLSRLSRFKVLILPNVNMMDDEELAIIRDWVWHGGKLYASGSTSLVSKTGVTRKNFGLADVFGATFINADWEEHNHYLAPTPDGQKFFGDFDVKYPAMDTGPGLKIKAHPGSQVLATTTLPWPAPSKDKFSSIHSDPPWQATDNPELVLNSFGLGKVIYCASLLESIKALEGTFVQLIRELNNDWHFEAKAPACVEVTMFHQPERKRYTVSLVNFQKELPNLPVDDIEVRLRLGEQRLHSIKLLPTGKHITYHHQNGVIRFTAPRLETLAMFAIKLH